MRKDRVLQYFLGFCCLILGLQAPLARAFTIEYSCGQRGDLLSFVSNSSELEQLRKYLEPLELGETVIPNPADLNKLCHSIEDCLVQFKAVRMLSGDTSIAIDRLEQQLRDSWRVIQWQTECSESMSCSMHDAVEQLYQLLNACLRGSHLQKSKRSETVTLLYPYNGPLRVISGAGFYKKPLEMIVRQAIAYQVDPYLALALVLKENAKTLQNRRGTDDDYTNKFGLVPIDKIAATELMGCGPKSPSERLIYLTAQEKKELDRKQLSLEDLSEAKQAEYKCLKEPKRCTGVTPPQKKAPVLKLSTATSRSTPRLYCVGYTVNSGEPADFVQVEASEKVGSCCIEAIGEEEPHFPITNQIKTSLALTYLKERTQDYIPAEGISHGIQRFNGNGCLGCAEKYPNACINEIIMDDRPVYGAQLADLLVNVMMTNPEIAGVVEREAKRSRAKVKSALCLSKGPGKHELDSLTFLREQQEYLIHGDKRFYLTSRTKNGRYLPAETEAQKKAYLERERRRKLACTNYEPKKPPLTFAPWSDIADFAQSRK